MERDNREIVKRAQLEFYSEKIGTLLAGKPLRPSSTSLGLTPFLDENGLMRLGGRIGRANLPYDQVHPLILPGRHPLRRLLIHALHEKLRHAGTGFVVLQHVWLIGGREAVKRVRYSRRFCIFKRGKPATQLMGELPISRLNIDALPFSRVAIDYFRPVRHRFGPKSGRRAKLFTCPTTRGVYLDLATSMSTATFFSPSDTCPVFMATQQTFFPTMGQTLLTRRES